MEPTYLLAGTLAAIFVYFTAHMVESRYRALLWLDAIGMAAYTVLGAAKGLALGFGPSVAIVTGISTATLGGILRVMVAGEPSVLMRREIYVTASLAGACLYVLLAWLQIEPAICAIAAALTAFVIRGGALYFGWTLPVYKAVPDARKKNFSATGSSGRNKTYTSPAWLAAACRLSCGRGPICWMISPAASEPKRAQSSSERSFV